MEDKEYTEILGILKEILSEIKLLNQQNSTLSKLNEELTLKSLSAPNPILADVEWPTRKYNAKGE